MRNALAFATHRFFQERDFLYLHAPVITSSDAEGAGQMFRVSTLDPGAPPHDEAGAVAWEQDFFGRPTFLTVSGQLEAETYACALDRVYTFGPTFRAENSNTRRHLAEFWMIEPEMAFADLADDADLAEDYVRYLCRYVLDHCPDDLAFFEQRVQPGLVAMLEGVAGSDFHRLTYTQAIALLEKADVPFEFPVGWGSELQSEHERYLTETVFGKPVIVTDFPFDIKAFYMRRNDDGLTVAAMDVLVPGIGEIVGGSRARGAPRRAARQRPPQGPRPRPLLVVRRPAPVRHRAPRRIRPRLRAPRPVLHRDAEHPRRHPLPADPAQRRLLSRDGELSGAP